MVAMTTNQLCTLHFSFRLRIRPLTSSYSGLIWRCESKGQFVGSLGRGIGPSEGRYLHRTTQSEETSMPRVRSEKRNEHNVRAARALARASNAIDFSIYTCDNYAFSLCLWIKQGSVGGRNGIRGRDRKEKDGDELQNTKRPPLPTIHPFPGSVLLSPTAQGQLLSFRKESIDSDTSAACSLSCRRPAPRGRYGLQSTHSNDLSSKSDIIYWKVSIYTARYTGGRTEQRFMYKCKTHLSWTFVYLMQIQSMFESNVLWIMGSRIKINNTVVFVPTHHAMMTCGKWK
jgi:hypothetical protein